MTTKTPKVTSLADRYRGSLLICISIFLWARPTANAKPPAPSLMASVQNKSGNSLTICVGNNDCKMIAPGDRLTNTQPRNGDDADALKNWLATGYIKTCERTIPLGQAVQPPPQERDQDGWYRLVIKEKYYDYACESQLANSSKDATLKRVAQSGVIKLGYADNAFEGHSLVPNFPFTYRDAESKPVGYAIDICLRIVDAIKKHLGSAVEIQYVEMKRPGRNPSVVDGRVDLYCTPHNNIPRFYRGDGAIDASAPIFRYNVLSVVKRGSGIEDVASVQRERVANSYQSPSAPPPYYSDWEQEMSTTGVCCRWGPGNYSDLLKLMDDGRVDAFIGDEPLLRAMLAHYPNPKNFEVLPQVLQVKDFSLLFRKDDPEFKQLVNDTITNLFRQGDIYQIYDKWFMQPLPPSNININWPMNQVMKSMVQEKVEKDKQISDSLGMAKKYLQRGEAELSVGKFSASIELFRLGLESIGECYVTSNVVDDSGQKLTLAGIEESSQRLNIAANLLKNVLTGRISLCSRYAR